jgi:hypothetical protein
MSASELQRLIVFARLQTDDTRLVLDPRAAAAHRAWRAVLPRKTRLEIHAALSLTVS